MTCFLSGQNRSRLRFEKLAVFCFNKSGEGYKKKHCISLIYKTFCLLSDFFSGPLWSGKRDSHSRCARVISRELLPTPPAPGRGALRSQGTRARSLRTFQRERENRFGSPCCFGAENGFLTQAYSSFTISALREAFSSKVTPAMRSSCTRLHPNAFDKDTNYFHTIQDRYSSCFLYTESSVFPSLSFHKIHPFEDRPMQKSEAILGLEKILSEAIVPLRSTGLFRIILFRKATNQVGHLPANLFRAEKFNLLAHPQNPLVEVERRP